MAEVVAYLEALTFVGEPFAMAEEVATSGIKHEVDGGSSVLVSPRKMLCLPPPWNGVSTMRTQMGDMSLV